VKILVIGLGAVGQRHVRNLRSLLEPGAEIIAYRARGPGRNLAEDEERRQFEQTFGIQAYANLDDALSQGPVAVFVCNPTSLHVPVALAAARVGCHLFIEKPISHTMEGLNELRGIVHERDLRTQVGFQFRFHPGLFAVNTLIRTEAIGRVTHVNVHWGEYLPSWHPWENYRESYSARSDLGGGVILTLCHPFDYLRWMLGEIHAVFAAVGRNGGLGIDVEDTADIVLEFESGAVGTVHLDYVQQPTCHRLQVIGTAGTVLWNNETGCVQWYGADRGEWQTIAPPAGFERNALFLAEVRHFLDCVAGHADPLVSLEDGLRTLELALAAKTSAAEARRVEIPDDG
jgi:predicted dehydrogenase